MRMVHRFTAPLALVLAMASCRSATPPGVYFDSNPRGAEVLVDGRRSGYVTPCLVALDEDDDFLVHFVLPGYETREVYLDTHSRRWAATVWDGAMAPSGLRGILGLDAANIFFPYVDNDAHAPSRIHLRLKPVPRVN